MSENLIEHETFSNQIQNTDLVSTINNNIENSDNSNVIVQKDKDISVESDESKKINKNYNGFLRKSRSSKDIEDTTKHVQEAEPTHKKNEKIHKKPNLKADMNNPNNPNYKKRLLEQNNNSSHDLLTPNKIESDSFSNANSTSTTSTTSSSSPITIKNNKTTNLLSYMRQKSGFNPNVFWNQLSECLQEIEFTKLTETNLSIISYAVLYDREEIYNDLLNKYSSVIPKEEYENTILTYCMNKKSTFLKDTLLHYQKMYKSSSEFVELLIEKAAKSSYRLENNQELMKWLDGKMLKKHLEKFWDCCLKERNIVLFEHALHYKKSHTYLMKNFSQYEDRIISIGKKYSVEKSFKEPLYFNDAIEPSEPLIYDNEKIEKSLEDILTSNNLGISNSQMKTIQKELHKPEIVIKKKKKIL